MQEQEKLADKKKKDNYKKSIAKSKLKKPVDVVPEEKIEQKVEEIPEPLPIQSITAKTEHLTVKQRYSPVFFII